MYFVAFCEVALIRILEEKGQDRGYLLVLMEQHLSRKLCTSPWDGFLVRWRLTLLIAIVALCLARLGVAFRLIIPRG